MNQVSETSLRFLSQEKHGNDSNKIKKDKIIRLIFNFF